MAYILDANVFIQAKNLHYGFDFCPAFWDWIRHENTAGRLFSIEKVGTELSGGADALSDWAEARGNRFFLRPDPLVLRSLGQVAQWANAEGFPPSAVNVFLQGADCYLVAHAHAQSHVVVTHEKVEATRQRVKVPVACAAMGIRCMTPFEMLRVERARFVLEQRR